MQSEGEHKSHLPHHLHHHWFLIYSNEMSEKGLLLFRVSDIDFSPLSKPGWPGTQENFIFMWTLTLDLLWAVTGAVVVTEQIEKAVFYPTRLIKEHLWKAYACIGQVL